MSQNKFLKGAAILGIAGIIVKVMGVFFRIPLTNWVGSEGISYYSSVYPIYTFFLILSTAGIPVAVSRMVSERIAVSNYGGAHKVFHTALWFLSVLGFATFAVVYFGAEFIEMHVLKNEGTDLALQAIAPALFIVPIMAAYRGYFQGRQNMNPTALSQLAEQFVRVAVGLAMAYYLIPSGYEAVSAGATFGCTAGAAAGLAVVILIYILNLPAIQARIRRNRSREELESTREIIKRILVIAIPITIGASIMPLMSAIDSAVVMRRLQATGWSVEESRHLWGLLGGYCNSLVGMPQVFTQAIVMSLVPAIAAGFKVRNLKEVADNSRFGMRAGMIVGFPCAVGMLVLAEPILQLLYTNKEECSEAAPILMIMCIGIIFMSSLQTLTGILQGVDKQMLPVKNLAIGALAKLVLTYILVGIRPINVCGGPVGTIAAYVIATVLNHRDLRKKMGIRIDLGETYLKPGLSALLMGAAAFASYKLLFLVLKSNTIALLAAILVGVVSYGALILLTRTITKDEIRRLPKGEKLVKLLDHFVK